MGVLYTYSPDKKKPLFTGASQVENYRFNREIDPIDLSLMVPRVGGLEFPLFGAEAPPFRILLTPPRFGGDADPMVGLLAFCIVLSL